MQNTRASAANYIGRPPNAAGSTQARDPGSIEVLQQLSTTVIQFRSFRDAVRSRLDPWEESSLSVTEQALERAWLAFSQLHADLSAQVGVTLDGASR